MPKTVTLRLNDKIYAMFRKIAEDDNRTLSNFIETSVLRYIENIQYIDEYEMEEINNNEPLKKSIERGFKDAKQKKGRFVE